MSALRLLIVLVMLGWVFANPLYANTVSTERTQATLLSSVGSVHAGQKFWVALHIKMQPDWHTYWKNPGDSGTPLYLTWTLPNGFAAGDIEYLAPDRLKIGPLVDYGYGNDAYYLIAITPPAILRDNETSILMVKAKWLVCKDICVPESADLSLALPATSAAPDPSTDAALIESLVAKVPASATHTFGYQTNSTQVHFDMPLKEEFSKNIKDAVFFPEQEGLINNDIDQQFTAQGDTVSFSLARAEGKLPESVKGLVSFFLQNGDRKDYEVRLQAGSVGVSATTPSSGGQYKEPLILTMLFAFLGGLILNAMPCVFPILSLKCLAIAKKAAAHPAAVRAQAFAYASGVILSFLGLAVLLIALQKGGTEAGWGYQMQSPIFVGCLALVLFVVGLNLSGYFEFPVLFGNVASSGAAKDSKLGSFLTGVLAVLVATPCTAPFMAPAIGFALTQSAVVVFAVFASLGLGLAAPFVLISLVPHAIRLLPKPGAWMIIFKQLLAFPMYLSAVWLLWVLAREAGLDAAFAALLGMVLIAFALWLWQRDALLLRVVAVLIVIIGGGAVVTLLHPVSTSQNTLRSHAENFSRARLDALRKEGKAVFVDATADWCITCKVNESVALASPEVMQAFEQQHITYMVADWTHDDTGITQYLESFGRRGVPLYVYYPAAPDSAPVVLPQILTPSIVMKAIAP